MFELLLWDPFKIYHYYFYQMHKRKLYNLLSRTDAATYFPLASDNGIRVNAGHDLNLENLADLLALGDIAEVSIGHAFTIESLEQGMDNVVRQYLDICA